MAPAKVGNVNFRISSDDKRKLEKWSLDQGMIYAGAGNCSAGATKSVEIALGFRAPLVLELEAEAAREGISLTRRVQRLVDVGRQAEAKPERKTRAQARKGRSLESLGDRLDEVPTQADVEAAIEAALAAHDQGLRSELEKMREMLESALGAADSKPKGKKRAR